MKILQLGKFYPIRGGVEKVMWDFTRGLGERGVDCDMLCAISKDDLRNGREWRRGGDSDLSGGVAVLHLNDRSRCICVRALAKKAATMISPAMIRYLRRHCDEYDIIHVHHPDPMAALALRLSGYKGKVVLHWHSDILKQRFLLKFYLPLQRWLIRRADRIVGTTPVYVQSSPFLRDVQQKCRYVPIGVEKLRVNQEKVVYLRDKYAGKKLIFSLGRLVEYKGYRYLVEAAKYLPADYIIAIGGSGPLKEELLSQIDRDERECIESGGLRAGVEILGYLTDEYAHAWMAAADVFVLPSVMKTEAFGIVQVEAMSCGTPVVATKIPGSGTAWVNAGGESGLNVEVRDARALAQAVLEITSGSGDYASWCGGALGRYERLFTYDRMISNVLEIYGDL